MADTTDPGLALYNKDQPQEGYGGLGEGDITRRRRNVDGWAIYSLVTATTEFVSCHLAPIVHDAFIDWNLFEYGDIANHTGWETDTISSLTNLYNVSRS